MFKKDLRTTFYIIKDGEVLGRVWGYETAHKVCFIREAAYCCIYEHLVQIEDEWLYQLYEKYVGVLPEPPMVIEQMARDVFSALEQTKVQYITKPSCKDVLRAMYEFKNTYTREEIDLMIPRVKWSSIRVAIAQLRHEGLDIRHTGDGFYVRQ